MSCDAGEAETRRYVTAAGLRGLTRFYDSIVAITMRERLFRGRLARQVLACRSSWEVRASAKSSATIGSAPPGGASSCSARYGADRDRAAAAVPDGDEGHLDRPGIAVNADEPIRLSAYDPDWPARFEEERTALEDAIGEWVVGGIHHVGSTAVPGLEAKPIIDILAGVRDLEESRMCFEPPVQLGYMCAPYLPDEMHWFCKPHPSRRILSQERRPKG
jgi:GrpB protein